MKIGAITFYILTITIRGCRNYCHVQQNKFQISKYIQHWQLVLLGYFHRMLMHLSNNSGSITSYLSSYHVSIEKSVQFHLLMVMFRQIMLAQKKQFCSIYLWALWLSKKASSICKCIFSSYLQDISVQSMFLTTSSSLLVYLLQKTK